MRSGPRVSVIVPVYNGCQTVASCLSALLSSALLDFEVIVVDDGSTDASASIAGRFDVRLIRLPHNSGASAARNAGVAASAAPLRFFLDADIVVPPS